MFNESIRDAMPITIPGYMTTAQAAEYLDVTPGRIRQLIASKVLPHEKIGNTNLIPTDAIETYKEKRPSAGWPKGKPRKS